MLENSWNTEMNQIRVLIADDHPVTRRGIRMFLSTEPCIKIVGEAADGQEAIRQVKRLRPDVVLIDLLIPKAAGVEAIARIKRYFPDVKIIVLTMFEDNIGVRAASRAGADGYVLKDRDAATLLHAIRTVQRGGKSFDPRVARHLSKDSAQYKDPGSFRPLTQREKEILQLVVRGLTNRDVAQELNISETTVKAHMGNIFNKLGVSNRTEAAMSATQLGLISPEEEE